MRIARLTKIQVERVLAGGNVLGKNQNAPIRYPNFPERRMALYEWTQDFLYSSGPRLTVRQRTAFIRKLANFLIRDVGRCGDEPLGISWFRQHPEQLTSKLSFAGAVRQARAEEQHARNHAEAALIREMKLDSQRPCGPPPVINRVGPFSLEQLTHPHHIGDVGAEAANCLASIQENGHLTPNAYYWHDVKSRQIRILALRHIRDLCVVFSVSGCGIVEWDQLCEPDGMIPALNSFLTRMNIKPVHESRPVLRNGHAPCHASLAELEQMCRAVECALAGDVPGAPPMKPLTLPKANAALESLRSVMISFIRLCGDHTDDDLVRFARKVTVYFTRHSAPDETALIRGAGYYAAHRNALSSKLSFAGAARLQELMWRTVEKRFARLHSRAARRSSP